MVLVRCCMWNPLSMRQAGRWRDVQKQLRSCRAIALAGTQCGTELPCVQDRLGKYHRFQWGRSSGSAGRPTGCSLLIRDCLFDGKQIRRVWHYEGELAGRLGAVRCKSASSDITFIVAYAPVEPPGGAGRAAAIRGCEKFWSRLNSLLDELPSRTVPLLMLDAKARVGSVASESLGSCEVDNENMNGLYFRETLEAHYLRAVNTYYVCGPTFYHENGTSTAR
eukprot:7295987-Pyramimonas_sp.AAC.1